MIVLNLIDSKRSYDSTWPFKGIPSAQIEMLDNQLHLCLDDSRLNPKEGWHLRNYST